MMAAVIFVVAVAARLVHVRAFRDTPLFDVLMGDARAYDAWVQRLAGGDWVGSDVFYQAPLYPYFLGVAWAWRIPSGASRSLSLRARPNG